MSKNRALIQQVHVDSGSDFFKKQFRYLYIWKKACKDLIMGCKLELCSTTLAAMCHIFNRVWALALHSDRLVYNLLICMFILWWSSWLITHYNKLCKLPSGKYICSEGDVIVKWLFAHSDRNFWLKFLIVHTSERNLDDIFFMSWPKTKCIQLHN